MRFFPISARFSPFERDVSAVWAPKMRSPFLGVFERNVSAAWAWRERDVSATWAQKLPCAILPFMLSLSKKQATGSAPVHFFISLLSNILLYSQVCGRKAPVNRANRFIGFWLNITCFWSSTAVTSLMILISILIIMNKNVDVKPRSTGPTDLSVFG